MRRIILVRGLLGLVVLQLWGMCLPALVIVGQVLIRGATWHVLASVAHGRRITHWLLFIWLINFLLRSVMPAIRLIFWRCRRPGIVAISSPIGILLWLLSAVWIAQALILTSFSSSPAGLGLLISWSIIMTSVIILPTSLPVWKMILARLLRRRRSCVLSRMLSVVGAVCKATLGMIWFALVFEEVWAHFLFTIADCARKVANSLSLLIIIGKVSGLPSRGSYSLKACLAIHFSRVLIIRLVHGTRIKVSSMRVATIVGLILVFHFKLIWKRPLVLTLALTRLAQHSFTEVLSFHLAINLIGQLADVLTEHGLLSELLSVVLLDTL